MTKRVNGEGTIRKHPTRDVYEARYYYTDLRTGERKRGSVYAKTRVEVRTKLKDVLERIDQELPAVDSKVTLAAWTEQWQTTSLKASDRKDTTKDAYRALSNKHIRLAPIGQMELARLRASHVETLMSELKDKGLAESTVRNLYAVLNAILEGAKRDGLIAKNPITGNVKRPKVTPREAEFLEASQVRELLAAASNSRYSSALELIAGTGIRRGEALALDWSNVDLAKGVIKIRWTLSRSGGELKRTPPKTANSRREIPVTDGMRDLLKKQRKRQITERLAAGNQWKDSGLVFTTEFGTAVDPRNLLRALTVVADKVGLTGIGIHTLRHSVATAMLEGGVPIHVVSRHLGHSSVAITGDIYGHVSDTRQLEAMNVVSAAFGV